MQRLELLIDGRSSALVPGPRLEREKVLVPVHAFSAALGAQVRVLEGSEQLVFCLGDLCVPILEKISLQGEHFTPLAELAEALSLGWQLEGPVLQVRTDGSGDTGLGIGMRPPAFELPDLYTGETFSQHDYKGKKAVFYMWASW